MPKIKKKKQFDGGVERFIKGVVESSSSISSKNNPLSSNQESILKMLTQDYLTVKQIANRRRSSIKSVYKVMTKLRKKGYLSGTVMGGVEKGIHPSNSTPLKQHKIRLHGQEFNIHILKLSDRYNEFYKKKNILQIDGNTLRLFRNSIELYSAYSFYSHTPKGALAKSMDFWQDFYKKLELKFGITILDGIKTRIKQVNAHYSEINNGLAKIHNDKGKKLRFKGEDGKSWLITDNSFKLNELETIHPELAHEDMEKLKPFFDDLRANPMKLSELAAAVYSLAKTEEKMAGHMVTLLNNNGLASFPPDKPDKNKKIPEYIN